MDDIQNICTDRDYQASLKTAEQARAQTTETEFYRSTLMHAAHYALTGCGRRLLLAFLQAGGFFFPNGGRPTEHTNTCFWEKLPCGLPMGKIMDVSTRHITHDDSLLLHDECDACLPAVIVFHKDATGFFVHVSHDDVEETDRAMCETGYSQAFINLVRVARAEGACMLCLDGGSASSEKLPVFDW